MESPEQDLVPISRAAGELKRSLFSTRNLALRGALTLVWRGNRMFVTRASLDQLKASVAEDRTPAIAGGR
jgi:hypothetical protein